MRNHPDATRLISSNSCERLIIVDFDNDIYVLAKCAGIVIKDEVARFRYVLAIEFIGFIPMICYFL